MTDFPSLPPTPLFVHTWSRYCANWEVNAYSGGASPAVLTWPSANRAFYYPLWLPWPYIVRRVFWINGSSVTSTNMDVAVYTSNGERVVSSGSTGASGVSAVQYADVTDTMLSPGRYFLAAADSSATASRGGTGATTATLGHGRRAGMYYQDTALPLPATMTPVTLAAAATVLFCGITRTASGF